jgi:hypothetical protein
MFLNNLLERIEHERAQARDYRREVALDEALDGSSHNLRQALACGGDGPAEAGKDGTVRLWDAATGQHRAAIKAHTGDVRAVAFSPDGKALASGGGVDGRNALPPGRDQAVGRPDRAGTSRPQRPHGPRRLPRLQPRRQGARRRRLGPDDPAVGVGARVAGRPHP